jgi:hypothetical protein
MSPVESLVLVFFINQIAAILLLIIAYTFDFDTYSQVATGRTAIIPGLRKTSRLFGLSRKAGFQVIYLFSSIFIIFSYATFILLITYTAGWFLGLL